MFLGDKGRLYWSIFIQGHPDSFAQSSWDSTGVQIASTQHSLPLFFPDVQKS